MPNNYNELFFVLTDEVLNRFVEVLANTYPEDSCLDDALTSLSNMTNEAFDSREVMSSPPAIPGSMSAVGASTSAALLNSSGSLSGSSGGSSLLSASQVALGSTSVREVLLTPIALPSIVIIHYSPEAHSAALALCEAVNRKLFSRETASAVDSTGHHFDSLSLKTKHELEVARKKVLRPNVSFTQQTLREVMRSFLGEYTFEHPLTAQTIKHSHLLFSPAAFRFVTLLMKMLDGFVAQFKTISTDKKSCISYLDAFGYTLTFFIAQKIFSECTQSDPCELAQAICRSSRKLVDNNPVTFAFLDIITNHQLDTICLGGEEVALLARDVRGGRSTMVKELLTQREVVGAKRARQLRIEEIEIPQDSQVEEEGEASGSAPRSFSRLSTEEADTVEEEGDPLLTQIVGLENILTALKELSFSGKEVLPQRFREVLKLDTPSPAQIPRALQTSCEYQFNATSFLLPPPVDINPLSDSSEEVFNLIHRLVLAGQLKAAYKFIQNLPIARLQPMMGRIEEEKTKANESLKAEDIPEEKVHELQSNKSNFSFRLFAEFFMKEMLGAHQTGAVGGRSVGLLERIKKYREKQRTRTSEYEKDCRFGSVGHRSEQAGAFLLNLQALQNLPPELQNLKGDFEKIQPTLEAYKYYWKSLAIWFVSAIYRAALAKNPWASLTEAYCDEVKERGIAALEEEEDQGDHEILKQLVAQDDQLAVIDTLYGWMAEYQVADNKDINLLTMAQIDTEIASISLLKGKLCSFKTNASDKLEIPVDAGIGHNIIYETLASEGILHALLQQMIDEVRQNLSEINYQGYLNLKAQLREKWRVYKRTFEPPEQKGGRRGSMRVQAAIVEIHQKFTEFVPRVLDVLQQSPDKMSVTAYKENLDQKISALLEKRVQQRTEIAGAVTCFHLNVGESQKIIDVLRAILPSGDTNANRDFRARDLTLSELSTFTVDGESCAQVISECSITELPLWIIQLQSCLPQNRNDFFQDKTFVALSQLSENSYVLKDLCQCIVRRLYENNRAALREFEEKRSHLKENIKKTFSLLEANERLIKKMEESNPWYDDTVTACQKLSAQFSSEAASSSDSEKSFRDHLVEAHALLERTVGGNLYSNLPAIINKIEEIKRQFTACESREHELTSTIASTIAAAIKKEEEIVEQLRHEKIEQTQKLVGETAEIFSSNEKILTELQGACDQYLASADFEAVFSLEHPLSQNTAVIDLKKCFCPHNVGAKRSFLERLVGKHREDSNKKLLEEGNRDLTDDFYINEVKNLRESLRANTLAIGEIKKLFDTDFHQIQVAEREMDARYPSNAFDQRLLVLQELASTLNPPFDFSIIAGEILNLERSLEAANALPPLSKEQMQAKLNYLHSWLTLEQKLSPTDANSLEKEIQQKIAERDAVIAEENRLREAARVAEEVRKRGVIEEQLRKLNENWCDNGEILNGCSTHLATLRKTASVEKMQSDSNAPYLFLHGRESNDSVAPNLYAVELANEKAQLERKISNEEGCGDNYDQMNGNIRAFHQKVLELTTWVETHHENIRREAEQQRQNLAQTQEKINKLINPQLRAPIFGIYDQVAQLLKINFEDLGENIGVEEGVASRSENRFTYKAKISALQQEFADHGFLERASALAQKFETAERDVKIFDECTQELASLENDINIANMALLRGCKEATQDFYQRHIRIAIDELFQFYKSMANFQFGGKRHQQQEGLHKKMHDYRHNTDIAFSSTSLSDFFDLENLSACLVEKNGPKRQDVCKIIRSKEYLGTFSELEIHHYKNNPRSVDSLSLQINEIKSFLEHYQREWNRLKALTISESDASACPVSRKAVHKSVRKTMDEYKKRQAHPPRSEPIPPPPPLFSEDQKEVWEILGLHGGDIPDWRPDAMNLHQLGTVLKKRAKKFRDNHEMEVLSARFVTPLFEKVNAYVKDRNHRNLEDLHKVFEFIACFFLDDKRASGLGEMLAEENFSQYLELIFNTAEAYRTLAYTLPYRSADDKMNILTSLLRSVALYYLLGLYLRQDPLRLDTAANHLASVVHLLFSHALLEANKVASNTAINPSIFGGAPILFSAAAWISILDQARGYPSAALSLFEREHRSSKIYLLSQRLVCLPTFTQFISFAEWSNGLQNSHDFWKILVNAFKELYQNFSHKFVKILSKELEKKVLKHLLTYIVILFDPTFSIVEGTTGAKVLGKIRSLAKKIVPWREFAQAERVGSQSASGSALPLSRTIIFPQLVEPLVAAQGSGRARPIVPVFRNPPELPPPPPPLSSPSSLASKNARKDESSHYVTAASAGGDQQELAPLSPRVLAALRGRRGSPQSLFSPNGQALSTHVDTLRAAHPVPGAAAALPGGVWEDGDRSNSSSFPAEMSGADGNIPRNVSEDYSEARGDDGAGAVGPCLPPAPV